jgi:uncharacterized membrane protein
MASASRSWLRAAGLGWVSGSRAFLGPALVARQARHKWLRRLAYLAAAFELVADKTPFLPSRTAPSLLAGRIVSGAGVARRALGARGPATGGALALGAAAAIAGAFVGLRFRLALTRRLGGGQLASALAGAIEDAALISVGRRLAPPRLAR